MADTTNTSDPKKLTDADLTQVSGGTIPDKIMAYVALLPKGEQADVMHYLPDDERHFLGLLKLSLERAGAGIQADEVGRYLATGKLR